MSDAAEPLATGPLAGGDVAAEVSLVLEHNGLAGASCAVAYLAFADPGSGIAACDEDGRLDPLIGFLPLPLRGRDLLDAVAAIDGNGPVLVSNYRRAFPDDAKRITDFDEDVGLSETAAPGWLFAACSLALGLRQEDVDRALQPSSDVVGLDTFVIEAKGRYVLDGRRFVRSLMSYRIGGASEVVLARSAFASIGRFVGDAVGRLLRDWRAEAIACVGDLFVGNAILRDSARRGLSHLGMPVLDPRSELGPAEDRREDRGGSRQAVAFRRRRAVPPPDARSLLAEG